MKTSLQGRETLEDAKSKIKSRRENTTFRYNYLVANAESIRQDVRKKEMQKDDIKLQIDTIHLSQVFFFQLDTTALTAVYKQSSFP